MIPRDFITEWRVQVPWIQELQVEQDLIITRAMVEMFSQAEAKFIITRLPEDTWPGKLIADYVEPVTQC